MQELTSYDKKTLFWGYAYFALITIGFGYLAIFSESTTVIYN